MAVCHPFRRRVWCCLTRTRWFIAITGLTSFLFTLPQFFVFKKVITTFENSTWEWTIQELGEFKNKLVLIKYDLLFTALFTFAPILILTALNFLVVRHIIIRGRKREQLMPQQNFIPRHVSLPTVTLQREPLNISLTIMKRSSTPWLQMNTPSFEKLLQVCKIQRPSTFLLEARFVKDHIKITILLVIVVLIFVVSQIPSALLLIYKFAMEGENVEMTPQQLNRSKIWGNYANFFVLLGCSSNFAVYSLFSVKFRLCFAQTFLGPLGLWKPVQKEALKETPSSTPPMPKISINSMINSSADEKYHLHAIKEEQAEREYYIKTAYDPKNQVRVLYSFQN